MHIEHRFPRVRFNSDGISIEPLLFSSVLLRWDDVDFVSPTPAYELADGKWRLQGGDLAQELADAGILELRATVHDRTQLPLWMRMILGSVYVKPLYDADDRAEPKRGVVTIHLQTSRLTAGVDTLLEILSNHSRFGLVVSF